MSIKTNADATVAVDDAYFWQPLSTCPVGQKVQLLTQHGVAIYGTYNYHQIRHYLAWAPLPRKPDWLKAGLTQPPGETK